MIVDSSAILAVLFREREGSAIQRRLTDPGPSIVGSPTWLETALVFSSRVENGLSIFRSFLADLDVETIAFEPRHADLAAAAFLRYGKGRHRRAALNYGDCMTYAIAKTTGLPLLCKGEDFAHTDLELVAY